jgi:F-type H+-transporting ATPase subunit b
MFLEINPLVLPDYGLVIWSTLAFSILFFLLTKFAWKPIMAAIGERETGISNALLQADKLKAEMVGLKDESEAMMNKAREERGVMIKEAKEQTEKMIAEAKYKAKVEYERIIADAQQAILQQKNAALTDVKNQIGALVIEVSEKILRRELANKTEQEAYIQLLAEVVNLN